MMNQPPIDELTKKVGNNKYKLSVLTTKWAKEIEKRRPAELEKSDRKAISIAAQEIFEGKVVADTDIGNK